MNAVMPIFSHGLKRVALPWKTIRIFLIACLFGIIQSYAAPQTSSPIVPTQITLKDGDLIFQPSRSSQSQLIRLITNSEYTHMGVIFIRNGEPFVLEAIQPVRYTPLQRWINRGEGGRFVIKRLQQSEQVLTKTTIEKMKTMAEQFMGRDYDILFQWSNERMYCSELAYKLYKESAGISIGKLQSINELLMKNPMVQKKLNERYRRLHQKVNLEELVISPRSMFEDTKLNVVFESKDHASLKMEVSTHQNHPEKGQVTG